MKALWIVACFWIVVALLSWLWWASAGPLAILSAVVVTMALMFSLMVVAGLIFVAKKRK